VPGPGLPVNVDSAYVDDGADATVKLHQQHHDVLHAFANEFDTATRAALDLWVRNSANTLFEPVMGESKHIPLTTFDLTGGGNYTFQLSDAGKKKGSLTTDTAAMTWTIPTNASVPFPIGTTIKVQQRGTGQITIAGASGVTLNAAGSAYKTAAQHATLLITQDFANTWLVEGGVL
jgi:hypothetical protein